MVLLFGDNEDIGMTGVNERSLLDSATTTFKAKHINTDTMFSSLLSSPNFTMDDDEIVLSFHLPIFLEKKWIDPKIIKTPVEVSIKKLFALDINFSAVKSKLAMAKTQLIKNFFSSVNGFGGATTLSKFEGIIQSTFTSEKSMEVVILLVKEKEININSNLKRQEMSNTGNRIHCAVVSFESDNNLESAFCMEPILGGIKLSWARINLVQCKKCRKFDHSVLECDAFIVSPFKPSRTFKRIVSNGHCLQFTKLYEKKGVPISCLAAFGGKFWAQVVILAGFSGGPYFSSGSGSGLPFSGALDSNSGSPLTSANNSSLNTLEYFLELLTDQVSSILKKLSSIELIPTATSFSVPSLATPTSLVPHLDVDMALNNMILASASFLSAVDDVVYNSSLSFSKVLTSKMAD
ncbi:hypothetical protein G9A89_023957 [Geosiphon pyriformis]|nr:hypothetical protein G9A89_023957 [Geosiphon pyriformis]